jgi:hypothetical protein
MTDIQGLYVINPKTKECILKSGKPLSFRSIEQITSYLLKKIGKRIMDYVEVLELENEF